MLAFSVDAHGVLIQHGFGARGSASCSSEPAYPAAGSGWVFEPAFRSKHVDGNTSTDLRVTTVTSVDGLTRICLRDSVYPLGVDLLFKSHFDEDVICTWTEIRHEEASSIEIRNFASSSINFGAGELYLTQFRGDWNDEMHMEVEKLGYGLKVLDSKLTVRAHQFRSPWFLLARDHPATETTGEVFAGSLAWPGSFQFAFEKLPTGSLHALCGMNPHGSEYHLEPGETLTTPEMVWAFSASGTRELTQKLQRWSRKHILRKTGDPRSVILNNWEATGFDFDEKAITGLFDDAKDVGIETFLLDDGWFGVEFPRDDDTQGLGDWTPNPKKLPDGVSALVEAANDRGLRFGIWIEPEMVSPKSTLFGKHPEWVIRQPGRELDLLRNQLVLDLTRPAVEHYVSNLVEELLTENPGISYLKWDCNRFVTQSGSSFLAVNRQSHLGIEYVRALDRIFNGIVKRHPQVEIMMCSGGGGRVDYDSMHYAHELWPSDNTDPARRIFIQWGYSHFYPASAISAHVTRMGDRPLKFAFDVAMSGRLGMDFDLAKLTPEEKAFTAAAISTYKTIRDVVQEGDLYRLESPYEGTRSSLLFSLDNRAVVFVYSLGLSEPAPLPLAGLEDDRSYRIREINRLEGGSVPFAKVMGRSLKEDGLPLPELREFESRVYELTGE